MGEIIVARYDDSGYIYGCSILDSDFDWSKSIRKMRQDAARIGTKIKVFRSDENSNSREKFHHWCDIMESERKDNERRMGEELFTIQRKEKI